MIVIDQNKPIMIDLLIKIVQFIIVLAACWLYVSDFSNNCVVWICPFTQTSLPDLILYPIS